MSTQSASAKLRVSSDVGGTFTDVVIFDESTGEVRVEKSSSTPSDFSKGVLDALHKDKALKSLGGVVDNNMTQDSINFFIHGSTVVINALTERKGAKTALLTNEGFRDILEIGRGDRPDIFNMHYKKPEPFIPRSLRFEVSGRLDVNGNELTPLNVKGAVEAAFQAKAAGCTSLAICFLHSYANPKHEELAADAIAKCVPELSLSISSHISREWREYERTNTVALNAFVQPVAEKYLSNLSQRLLIPQPLLYVMTSNGGCATFNAASSTPIALVESGPVAGIMGSAMVASLVGESNVISFDVGGTTAKTSVVCDGKPTLITEYHIEKNRTSSGYPIQVPTVDIVEIGSGGGSIAFVNTAGRLCVGEESAGAVPGPACYMLGGTRPTVTDANLVLGRLNPDYFLGGNMKVSLEAAKKAVEPLAKKLQLSIEETALGIVQMSDVKKQNIIKLVSVNRGHDPRDFVLVAHGGGGPMHAAAILRELKCKKVIIPENPGAFSAISMLMTDLRTDSVVTCILPFTPEVIPRVNQLLSEMETSLLDQAMSNNQQRTNSTEMFIERFMDLRYKGQEHTVKVPISSVPFPLTSQGISEIASLFASLHEKHYSFKLDGTSIEVVNLHVVLSKKILNLKLKEHCCNSSLTLENASKPNRQVLFEGFGFCNTAVYERDLLPVSTFVQGPAVIEECTSSTVLYPDQKLHKDKFGFLHIERSDDTSFVEMSLDPFVLDIIREGLISISDEMFLHMKRTSMSTIIYEVLDFATGVMDNTGDMLTQGNGVAGFLATVTGATKATIEKFWKTGQLYEGDVVITNDPYSGGGTHLSDVALVKPIFFEGKLLGFAANKAHWTEVGGMAPGSWTTNATEVYQEGLQFPCVKLINKGVMDQSLLEIIAVNVRTPQMSLGDLHAQAASLKIAENRLLELCKRYKFDTMRTAMNLLLYNGEKATEAALKLLPSGTYKAEDFIDDDGLGFGPIKMVVKVTIKDGKFIVDYTGSPPPVRGPINCGFTALEAATRVVFQAVIDPHAQISDGCFRKLEIICPENTIVSAKRPASVGTYWETMIFASDLIWKALAPHVPNRLSAGHFLSVCGTVVSGLHPNKKELFILVEPQAGGWGATEDSDGTSALVCVGDGETYIIPTEICESRYGILVERFQLDVMKDECGAGKFRGGLGLVRDYKILAEVGAVTGTFGRFVYPPWGMSGGKNGSRNYMQIIATGEKKGKMAGREFKKGEVIRLVTACGGGFGDPKERPREMVLHDLHEGYITLEVARKVYGQQL